MEKNVNDIIPSFLLEMMNNFKANIKESILNLYQNIPKEQSQISRKELEKILDLIWTNINEEINKLSESIIKAKEAVEINESDNKNDAKVESNSELNIFTSKDIQEENKEITRNLQNEAYNYMNNEQNENENIAKFLIQVARISRIAYNVSLKLMKEMKEKFIESKNSEISFDDENIKKEFSFCVKNLEKEKNIFKDYENILNQENIFENKNDNINEKKYLIKLYRDLAIMYFHCHLAFPCVEINFKEEEDFNSEKMIDFINRGKNRKVNFVILPSLISNGCYLQNGKSWVFTFLKNTFKFENNTIISLNDLLDVEKYMKDNIEIIVHCKNEDRKQLLQISTNIDIPQNVKYEFVLKILNKDSNKIFSCISKSMQFTIDKNWEIINCGFKVGNKIIISSNNIINDNE